MELYGPSIPDKRPLAGSFSGFLNVMKTISGENQQELAQRVGCDRTSMSRYLKGGTVPRPKTREMIQDAFGLTDKEITQLLHGSLAENSTVENSGVESSEVAPANDSLAARAGEGLLKVMAERPLSDGEGFALAMAIIVDAQLHLDPNPQT